MITDLTENKNRPTYIYRKSLEGKNKAKIRFGFGNNKSERSSDFLSDIMICISYAPAGGLWLKSPDVSQASP